MSENKSAARVAAELVHPLFAYHNWTWSGYSQPEFVPTVEQIEEEYDRLARYLYDFDSSSIATGRLCVLRGDREQGTGDQYLLNVVEVNCYTGEAM